MQRIHIFEFRDGKIVAHWANRDDLGTTKQLGFTLNPPQYGGDWRRALRCTTHCQTGMFPILTGRSMPTASSTDVAGEACDGVRFVR
ncbi:MAG: ester cyclase [Thermomicrobia bacterium]|nr:ester cyclase [Thermomicrobia bacterium]